MKISFLGTDGIPAKYGGFETCVEEISTRLVDRGHDVAVYCKNSDRNQGLDSYKGVRLIHFPVISSQALDYAYNAFLSTVHAGLFRKGILHYFGCDQVPSTLLARLLGGRVLLSLDGLEWQRMSYPRAFRAYLRSFAELAMTFPHETTADSMRSVNWYQKRTGSRPTYLPYGVNISEEIDLEVLSRHGLELKRYILFVGRLVYEKGAHTVVEAFKEIKGDYRLVVVGDSKNPGDYIKNLKQSADERTLFLGFVHGAEYETLRNAALIYVHPSLFDGTSISLLAAMAAGKGIVSSDIEDNVEVGGDAVCYFRTEEQADLAKQMRQLMDDPARIAELGAKASKRIKETYDWDRITDGYEKMYTIISMRKANP